MVIQEVMGLTYFMLNQSKKILNIAFSSLGNSLQKIFCYLGNSFICLKMYFYLANWDITHQGREMPHGVAFGGLKC